MLRPKLLIFILLLFLFGCETAPPTPTAVPFDRDVMINNITYGIIMPSHEAFETVAESLVAAAQTFVETPNAANLDALQQAWLETNLAHMATTPFDFGPIRETRLHNRLDSRPSDTIAIQEILAGDTPITTKYIETIGSNKVGLGAMEHLIFDAENGDTAVLAAFTTDPQAENRRAYLLAVAEHIRDTIIDLKNIWDADGANYAQWFAESSGEMESSMNMLVNQMLADLENLVNMRVGFPLGKLSADVARPEQIEAPFSHMSLLRIIATVETLHTIYSGGQGSGLDDYLDFLDATYEEQPLSQVIHDQFDAALAALNAIDEPLETAVVTQPEKVNAAYDELHELLILLKVDMVNQLGIILTFNDNDGD
jgi:predicted lipoprotein